MLAVQCHYPVQKGTFGDDWSRTDALPVAQPIVIVLVHWRGLKASHLLLIHWLTSEGRWTQFTQASMPTVSIEYQLIDATPAGWKHCVSAMQKYGPLSFRMRCGCLLLWILHENNLMCCCCRRVINLLCRQHQDSCGWRDFRVSTSATCTGANSARTSSLWHVW